MPGRPLGLLPRRNRRRGGAWRPWSRCAAPRRVHRLLESRRVLALGLAALAVLGTGVMTLALGPVVAHAATPAGKLVAADAASSGLPDVTVHVTTAPMTNMTLHTGVTQTASCPSGTVLVGGGGYLRDATNPSTAPSNGLVLGGSNPSAGTSPVDQPVTGAATDPSHWMAIANFTGQSEAGDQTAAFALCASNGPTRTVVAR